MAINAGDIVWNIGANIKNFERELDKSKKKLKGLNTSFADVSKKAGVAFTAAGASITAGLGVAVAKSQEFSKAMAEVNTLGVKDLGALSDAVKDVSAGFGQELTVSANAAYQAISAGASEAEVPRLLEEAAKAATAGVTELSTAVELGTSVTNAFGMEISEASVVFDQAFTAVKGGVTTFEELSASLGKLSPIMSAAGLSTGEMFAAVAALTKGGIGTAEAVTGLKAAMSNIIKPGGEAVKIAESLGLQFDVTALKSQGLVGFLNSVKEATGGNLETMAQLFGSTEALNAVLALTGEQAGSFASLAEQMANAQGASNEAFQAFVDANPGFAFDQLKQTISVLMVEIGDKLAPTIIQLVETIKPVIDTVIQWIQNNPQLASTITIVAAAIGGLMVVLGPLLLVLPGIATAFSAVAAIAPVVGASIGAIILPVMAVIAAVTAAAVLIVKNWEWVKDATARVFEGIAVTIQLFVHMSLIPINTLIEAINFVIDKINQLTGMNIGNIPGFAQGGVVPGYAQGGKVQGFASGGAVRMIKVGERGPEMMAAPVGSRVVSHPDMMRAISQGAAAGASGGGGVSATFNINVDGSTDTDALMQKLKGPFSRWMADEFRRARR